MNLDTSTSNAMAGGESFAETTRRRRRRLGVHLSVLVAYDPYAVAGTVSKIVMATDGANLSRQFFEDLTALDAPKAFSTRIAEVSDSL